MTKRRLSIRPLLTSGCDTMHVIFLATGRHRGEAMRGSGKAKAKTDCKTRKARGSGSSAPPAAVEAKPQPQRGRSAGHLDRRISQRRPARW